MNTDTNIHWATGIEITFHNARDEASDTKWTVIAITDEEKNRHEITVFDQPDIKIAGNKLGTLQELKRQAHSRLLALKEAEHACADLRSQLQVALAEKAEAVEAEEFALSDRDQAETERDEAQEKLEDGA